ncbi:MAG: peroxiredoxin family protein, partial [Muribaculaceae bacterium]|nr:peroxiredoxin family protein [Muribaculaceae bacterium]
MKKLIPLAAFALIMASCSSDKGTATIQLPSDFTENTIVVSHLTIDNIFNAKQAEDLQVIYDTLDVKNGVAILHLDKAGAARYSIEPPVMARMQPEFYATPNEALDVKIVSFEPLDYDVKGTKLMEDIMTITSQTQAIQQEYMDLVTKNPDVTAEQVKEVRDRYDNAIKKFVADNPNSHAIPYIIQDLSGDDFKAAYDNMTPEAKKSILMPFAELYNTQVEEMVKEREAEEARQAEVASGKIEAPGFTLPDLAGKKVSLSDFRGKWVVLDFWG